MLMSSPDGKGKVFYGWWIVSVVSVLAMYGGGVFYYGFSTFVKPVVKELGWSVTAVSGAFSIFSLEAGMAAPIVGYLLDRIGPRNLTLSGGLLMGAGFIYLSYVNTVPHFYAAIIITSFGFSAFSGLAVGGPLVGKWFVKKRGRAIGIYSVARGLGGLLVPVVAYLILHYGWRSALLIMGPLTWLVVLPLSFTLKHSPEQCGLLPDGEPSAPVVCDAPQAGQATEVSEVDFSLRKAMATSAFWILTVCQFLHQINQSAVFVHIIPYLIDVGINPAAAASVVTFLALTSMVGRYGFGWLGDRFNKKWLLTILFVTQSIGILSLVWVRHMTDLIPFVVLYSIAFGGTIVIKTILIGDYYGRKNYGMIFGAVQGFSVLGGIAGPLIAGLVYDIRGTYHLAFISFAIMLALTAILTSFLKCPVFKQ